MKILIAGGTGFIGEQLIRSFIKSGSEVHILSRNKTIKHKLTSNIHFWEPMFGPPPTKIVNGVDVVINLSGEPVLGVWTKKKKEKIFYSRQFSTRGIVQAIERATIRPKFFICASAIGYYRNSGNTLLTENAPADDSFLANTCLAWEKEAKKAEMFGTKVASIRIGLVLGRKSQILKILTPLFKLFLGGKIGKGNNWWSWIHEDDLINIFHYILEKDLTGAINGTSPQPTTQKTFIETMGKILHRPNLFILPSNIIKILIGDLSEEILYDKKIIPEKLIKSQFSFKFPSIDLALTDLIKKT